MDILGIKKEKKKKKERAKTTPNNHYLERLVYLSLSFASSINKLGVEILGAFVSERW